MVEYRLESSQSGSSSTLTIKTESDVKLLLLIENPLVGWSGRGPLCDVKRETELLSG